MLLVQDSIQLVQRRVQSHFLEGHVGGLLDGIRGLDLATEHLGLQAAEGGHSDDIAAQNGIYRLLLGLGTSCLVCPRVTLIR